MTERINFDLGVLGRDRGGGVDRKSSRDGVGLEHLLRQGKIIFEHPDYYRVRKTAPPRSTVGTEIVIRNWGIPCTPKKSILE